MPKKTKEMLTDESKELKRPIQFTYEQEEQLDLTSRPQYYYI